MKSILISIKDNLIGYAIVIAICIFLVFIGNKMVNKLNGMDEEKCVKEHGGAYATEELWGTTTTGCTIKRIKSFDKRCNCIGHVFFTTCPGSVTWEEKSNKATNTVTNTTTVIKDEASK